MTQGSLSHSMQREFNLLTRKITYITAAIVCVLALIFWWLGVEVKGHMATLVGGSFIAMAVFTFQIPYITYQYMLRKYKDEPDKLLALGPSWREFRKSAMQRKRK